jgi:hypothetical protein
MRPAPPSDAESIHVYLLPEPPPEPPLPEPPLPEASSAAAQAAPASAVAQPRPRAPAAAPSTALPAPQATASEAPAPISLSTLFNPDGSIRLPAAEKPSAHEAGLARGRELMARGHNLLHCRRSAYDPAPTPEQAGNQAAAGAAMWHLMFGGLTRNDPDQIALAARDADAAGEMASAKRAVAMRACDDDLYHASPPQPAKP